MKYIPLLAIGFFLVSCFNRPKAEQQNHPDALPYPVVQILSQDITGENTYPVSLEGIVNNEVRAKISGYITRVYVDEGQRVRRGQLLFHLETDAQTEDAAAAQANIDAAQVGVDQLKPLVEQKIVSPIQLQTAEARLAQAKANYKAITASIGYANISSPVDGYVGKIPYRLGSLVDPSSPLPLTTVSQTDQIYGYFAMNEADYTDFLQKTPGKTLKEKISHFPEIELQLSNGDIYIHKGKITTVTAQVDPSTGTVSFRATFPNPEHLLANGSSGIILIPQIHKSALLVPLESTYELQGQTYVIKVLEDSTVTPQLINVSNRLNNLLIATSGIQSGDKIVARGVGTLQDKTKIIPQDIPFDSLTIIQTSFR